MSELEPEPKFFDKLDREPAPDHWLRITGSALLFRCRMCYRYQYLSKCMNALDFRTGIVTGI
jgi:hypothetical protein